MKILFEHLEKYPKMCITDAVKLLYQGEFGGGHLILDENACKEYLKREYTAAFESDELIEDIGSDMCRVYLGAAKKQGVDYLKIAKAFILSANEIKGDVKNFENKLKNMLLECEKGNLPFSYDEVKKYIEAYKEKNYPPVSHSETYRENYHPAYRVMQKKYAVKLISKE